MFASLLHHFRREQRLATAIDRQGQKRKRSVDVLALYRGTFSSWLLSTSRVGDKI